MPSAFPTDEQVQTFLQEAGALTGDLPSSLEGISETARLEWERDTGYTPWLAETQERLYDPPEGSTLDIRGGLLSVDTLAASDVELVEGTDFWLQPANALQEGKPYTYVKFLCSQGTTPQSISITGPFGYSEEVSQDVFDAVLRKAAVIALPTIQNLSGGGGVRKVKQDDVEIEYQQSSEGSSLGSSGQWEDAYCATLKRYRRAKWA